MANIYQGLDGKFISRETWYALFEADLIKPTRKIRLKDPIFRSLKTGKLRGVKKARNFVKKRKQKHPSEKVYTYYRWELFFIRKDSAPEDLPYSSKDWDVLTIDGEHSLKTIAESLNVYDRVELVISRIGGRSNIPFYHIIQNGYKYRVLNTLTRRQIKYKGGNLI